jgi:hypothetical protein
LWNAKILKKRNNNYENTIIIVFAKGWGIKKPARAAGFSGVE